MFMDSFATSALSLSCFIRPVANFVGADKEETANEWRLTAKAKGFSQTGNVHA